MASRRANGEGTRPRQRSDGTWFARIRTIDAATGLRTRVDVYGKTAEIVTQKVLKLRGAIADDGGYKPPDRTATKAFLERWLDDVAATTVRASTLRSYRWIVNAYLIPTFGHVPLRGLAPPIIARGVSAGGDDPASPRVRQLMLAVLHRALQTAVAWDMLKANPASSVEKPRVARSEFQVLTPSQVRALLADTRVQDPTQRRRQKPKAAGDRLHALYMMAIYSGLREGELLALGWEDVDLDAGRIGVRFTLEPTSLKRVEVKTRRSRRSVDIGPALSAELRAHRARMLAEGHPHGLVFPDHDGKPIRASNFTRRSWKPLLCRVFGTNDEGKPIVDIRFHDLRHTAATLMLLAGVHPKVVSERLGHASVAFTLDTYSHVVGTLQKDAAVTLERFIAG